MNEKTALDTIPFSRRPTFGAPPANNNLFRRYLRTFALLAFAPCIALLWSNAASAQPVHVAGQLLIDVNATRGLTTNTALDAGETNVTAWANHGTVGGEFDAASNSVYAITGINPPEMTNYAGILAPSSPNGRMMVANFNTPTNLQGHVPYSVECWFYEVSFSASPDGVFGWTLSAPPSGDAGIFSAANIAADANDANSLNWTPSGAAPSLGAWHYGVITYDGTTESAYLDGVLTNSALRSLNFVAVNASAAVGNPSLFSYLLAIPAVSSSSRFNGAIASLRVHTEALSGPDVASNFLAGISAVPVSPTNSITLGSSPVTSILGTSATLNGILTASASPSTTSLQFFYDTKDDGDATNAWPHSVTVSGPVSLGAFSANISGLTIGTTYYAHIYAVNSGATNMSSFAITFKTAGLPAIVNSGAFFTAPGSDNLLGNLTNDGTEGSGAYVICYYGPTDGGTNSASWANSVQVGPSAMGLVPAPISGLITLGNYYFTFEATNIYGTNWATPSKAFQEGSIFSLNTTNLPAASLPPAALTPISSWQSSSANFSAGTGAAVHDLGGVQYADFISTSNLYAPTNAFPGGVPNSITINGASLVAVLEPTGVNNEAGNTGGTIITTVYDTQFGIGFGGGIHVPIYGGSVIGVTIASGGSGYTNSSGVPVPPTVTISPPGGMSANTTATGTALVSAAGVVTNVVITSGGSGYPWQRTAQVRNMPLPTVTFSPGVTTATGTAVMGTNVNGFQIETVVNTSRPSDTTPGPNNGYNWADTTYGVPVGNDVYIPSNQVSVVSVVAGSGTNSVGQPTPTGTQDNNYLVYVNGVLVEDTASGFVSGLTLTATNGAGYLPHSSQIPLSFNTPPGGTPATGYMTVSGSTTIPGHISSVTLTSGGTGYTAANPPVLTIPAPTDPSNPQTNAVITFTSQSLGNYLPAADGGRSGLDGAPSGGYDGGGMNQLEYAVPTSTYGSGNASSTFGVGDQAGTGEIGYIGYMGDVYVYGEALTPAQRQAIENAAGAKFITSATLTFSINTSISGAAGSAVITAPSSVLQGYSATFTATANPGYAITGVTVNGTAVTLVNGSYTINNVSATQAIVVTTLAVPQQQVTVTYGAGGSVLTNGTIAPSGTVYSVAGGTVQTLTFSASAGNKVTAININGTNEPITGFYTFANIGVPLALGTNNTINVTFASLPTSPVSQYVPESQSLFFSVDTSSLPQTSGTAITNWPMYYSSQNSNTVYNGIGVYETTTTPTTNTPANTYQDANGVIWEQNQAGDFYQFYYGFAGPGEFSTVTWEGTTPGTVIPNTGATIMTVVSPAAEGATQGWNSVVNVFFGCLELSVNPAGLIQAFVDNNQGAYDGNASAIATSTYAIPTGTNTVLSLVAQANGSFMVYANTQLVISNAGIAPHSLYLQSDYQGYLFNNNIYIGSDGPDGASDYIGLIGNTYFWTTALTTPERTNLEAALMTQFHAVVPPNYNWIGANGANFSSLTSWSNTVPLAANGVPTPTAIPFFSFPGSGQTVNLDSYETLAGLIFSTNTIISSAAENQLTLMNGATAGFVITLTNNASPTIDTPISVNGALYVSGNGSLTVTNSVTLNGAGNIAASVLDLARGTSNSVVFTQNGGALTPYYVAQSWTAAAVGPGVMLGGAANAGGTVVYNLNGGTLATPNIGCVTDSGAVLVAPSTYGATAILNLNGGILQATESDSTDDARSQTEGSAHLIFNTTHTWINAGGAIINNGGFATSIAVPLEHYPSGPDIDGGFTLTGSGYLTNMSYATYTGPTRIEGGTLVCMLTNSIGGNTLDIDDGGILSLNFTTGTLDVYQLTINAGAPMAVGTYGATGSGATHIDNTHFSGNGTVTVLGVLTNPEKPNFTGTVFSGSVAGGTGSIVLSGTGGIPGGTYEVLGSTNVATPLSNWVTIATGTFTSSGFSTTIPVTTNIPQQFIKVVVP